MKRYVRLYEGTKGKVVLQKFLFTWGMEEYFNTVDEAKKKARRINDSIIRSNKVAKRKENEPNAYGETNMLPMRIIDTSKKPYKYIPATKEDEVGYKETGAKQHYEFEYRG